MKNQLQSYGASPSIWDHTVLPTFRRRRTPRLTPFRQAGQYSIYLPRMDGRLSWPGSSTLVVVAVVVVVTDQVVRGGYDECVEWGRIGDVKAIQSLCSWQVVYSQANHRPAFRQQVKPPPHSAAGGNHPRSPFPGRFAPPWTSYFYPKPIFNHWIACQYLQLFFS